MLSYVQLYFWKFKLHTNYEDEVLRNKFDKRQCVIHRPENIFRKILVTKLIKSLTNFIYQSVSSV